MKRIALLLAVIGLFVAGLTSPAYASEETDDPGYGTTCDQACQNAWLVGGDDGSGKAATTGIVRRTCVTSGIHAGATTSTVDSYTVVPKRGDIVNTVWAASPSSFDPPGVIDRQYFYRVQFTWVNLSGQVQNQYRYTANSSVLTPSLYGGAKAGTITLNVYYQSHATSYDTHCGPTHGV